MAFCDNVLRERCPVSVGLPCYVHLRARRKGGGVRFRKLSAVPHAFLEVRDRDLSIRRGIAARVSQKIPSGTRQRVLTTVRIESASHEAQGRHLDQDTAGLSPDFDTKYVGN